MLCVRARKHLVSVKNVRTSESVAFKLYMFSLYYSFCSINLYILYYSCSILLLFMSLSLSLSPSQRPTWEGEVAHSNRTTLSTEKATCDELL